LALKRFDEAKSKVQEGLDRFPNQLNLLRIAADIYRTLGNRDKSLEYAESIIFHFPNDYWNGFCRAALDLIALKRFDEAQARIQEGLSKIPNQINLLHIANDVYRASGNREKSLEYAESLILHHPSDWSGYGRSAQDLAALKRFDEAQARIQEGLNKLPNQINLLQIANDIDKALGKPG
jgi:predicted Zn-dependent protease